MFGSSSGSGNLWTVGAGVGYVFRLEENHVNIIPRFGVSYSEADVPGGSASATTIQPGILLSYAFNNTLSVNGGYTYGRDVDSSADVHGFSVGSQVALSKRLGLNLNVLFTDENGFSGASAGFTYHF